jgi:hypothetical protein
LRDGYFVTNSVNKICPNPVQNGAFNKDPTRGVARTVVSNFSFEYLLEKNSPTFDSLLTKYLLVHLKGTPENRSKSLLIGLNESFVVESKRRKKILRE